jgi:hypothetical protein
MKCRFFWDVAPCSHVEVDRRFRRAYCLHHHPTSQKTLSLIPRLRLHSSNRTQVSQCLRGSNLRWDTDEFIRCLPRSLQLNDGTIRR